MADAQGAEGRRELTEIPVHIRQLRDVVHHVDQVGRVLDGRRLSRIEAVAVILREHGIVRKALLQLCALLRVSADADLHGAGALDEVGQ